MKNFIGQQLGSYRLLHLLGQGGFAEVYLGEHVRLGMKAAIKILHTHLADSEIDSFQQEARIIADLKHPHIIRVLDFDVQQGVPFLVLDYASRGSLRQKHPVGTVLPATLVAEYVTQIASALQYAHDKKLIHRDIKPENMLIGEQGDILLSDFGIATIAHSTSSMHTQNSLGTLAYMPPEQIQGKPRPQSDQYALAVTAYHWLSGVYPFEGSSAELLAQHLAVEPPPLRSKTPQVSVEIEEVIATALAKDPALRFGSVQAFATALALASGKEAAHLSNTPAAPSPVEPTQLAGTPVPAPVAQLATPNIPPPPPMPAGASNPPARPQPVFNAAPQRPKRNAWGIWLVGTLIITTLGVIALLVIPNLIVYGPHSTGTGGNFSSDTTSDYTPYVPPPDYPASATARVQSTAAAARSSIDPNKPYIAEKPGPGCDMGGADWDQSEGTPVTCNDDGTLLSSPDDFSTIDFYWIQDFPQKFTASVDVSQVPPGQGCIMFKIFIKDIFSSNIQFSGIEVCRPDIQIDCCSSPISDTTYQGSFNKSAFTFKIARGGSSVKFYVDNWLVYTGKMDSSIVFQKVYITAYKSSAVLKHFVFTPQS